ncbi:MAG: prepilin peptidase [Rhodospirillales bacterium]|nr:prepilin peptidase [Rhodospirillales bacterium]
MIPLILFLFCVCVAIGTGLLVGFSDFRGMTIPNRYSLMVVGAFVCAFSVLSLTGREDVFSSLGSHLGGAGIMFAVTLWMFAAGMIGAGDSKIGTAFALWAGLAGLPVYLFSMALSGGVLGFLTLALRRWTVWPGAPEGSWVARAQRGESVVPYGIAIVFGAIFAFVFRGYVSPDVFVRILDGSSS